MAGLAALSLPQPPHPFECKAGAFHFRPNAANSQNEAVFEIPVANLAATPEPGLNRRRMHVSVLALVKDSSGQVVDKFSQDSSNGIPHQNLAKARATTITFTHPLPLPPGCYTMETAVPARASHRTTTSHLPLASSEPPGARPRPTRP